MARGRGRASFVAIFGIVAIASTSACAGKSDDDSDADGSGGTGGTGGTGGASPQPARIGLSMMIRNSDAPEVAGRQCPTSTGVQWDLGKSIVTGGMVTGVDSPSPWEPGTTLASGEEGAEITCRAFADGAFHAEGGGTDPQITVPDGLINFAMDGRADANATLSVYTPRTGSVATNAGFPSCTITAHLITAGALWADFDCPALTDPTNSALACRASGTLALEYCATE